MFRIAFLVLPMLLAGCAADGAGGLTLLPASAMHASPAEERDQLAALGNQPRTMAAKVLAAMALERVTGRKPDPARFNDP